MGVIKKKPRGIRTLSGWEDEYYLKCYELAKGGMDNNAIAMTIGVTDKTFKRWIKYLPALQEALHKARTNEKGGAQTFRDFVYGRLPRRLREFWDEIDGYKKTDTPEELLNSLEKESLQSRMQIYLYAYVACNFNMSEACRKLGFSTNTIKSWVLRYPKFSELVQSIHEAKKDFFESALINLIKKGDTSAILFANRTINRDRGYNDKVEISHTGIIEHRHSLDELNLPLETRKQIRDAMRNKQKALPAPLDPNIQEAEYEEIKK